MCRRVLGLLARAALFVPCTLSFVVGSVHAEDESPAHEPKWHRAASEVTAHLAAGKTGGVTTLLEQSQVDVWLVVDVLLARGAAEQARALAKLHTGPLVERLPAYIDKEGAAPVPAADRKALDDAARAIAASDLPAALASLTPLRKAKASVPMVWGLFILAQLDSMQGNVQQGAATAAAAAKAAHGIGWWRAAFAAGDEAARAALNAGDERGAVALWRAALELPAEASSLEERAAATINLGYAYGDKENVHESLRSLEAGKRLTRGALAAKNPALIEYRFNACMLLGLTYWEVAEFGLAHASFDVGLRLAKHLRAARAEDVAHTFYRRGQMELALGLDMRAEKSFAQATARFEALGVTLGALRSRGGVGAALLALERPAEAVGVLEEVVVRMREGGAPADYLLTELGHLALAYEASGQIPKGHSILEEALALAKEKGRPGDVGWVRLTRARLWVVEQQFPRAVEALEGAVAEARSRKDLYQERHAQELLAKARLGAGDLEGAIAAARVAGRAGNTLLQQLADAEASQARRLLGDIYGVGMRASIELGDIHEATFFSEASRGMAFLKTLGSKRAELVTEIPSELQGDAERAHAAMMDARARQARARRTRMLKRVRKAKAEVDAAVAAWEAAALRLERASVIAARVAFPTPATADEIQASLRPGEALVFFGDHGGGQVHALVFEHGGEPRVKELGDRSKLMTAGEKIGRLSADVSAERDAAEVAGLRKAMVDTLGLAPSTRSVLVSPVYELNHVPMARLFAGRTVSYIPSGSVLRALRNQRAEPGRGVIALGDPDYGAHRRLASAGATTRGAALTDLPASRDEVKRVAGGSADLALLGAAATESAFRDALAKRNAAGQRIASVHFACHGLLDPHTPRLSSLAITPGGGDDGYLTAAEVVSLSVPADLVVLSACETARGGTLRGQAMIGMIRSFMLAGSPRVIGSLWKVDDAATQALMIKFYELWKPKDGKGISAAEALEQAQAHVRDFKDASGKQAWKHPYYWAAWVLWGLPE